MRSMAPWGPTGGVRARRQPLLRGVGLGRVATAISGVSTLRWPKVSKRAKGTAAAFGRASAADPDQANLEPAADLALPGAGPCEAGTGAAATGMIRLLGTMLASDALTREQREAACMSLHSLTRGAQVCGLAPIRTPAHGGVCVCVEGGSPSATPGLLRPLSVPAAVASTRVRGAGRALAAHMLAAHMLTTPLPLPLPG